MRVHGTAPGTGGPGTRHNSAGYVGSITRQTRRAPCPVCNKGPRDTALSITTDELGTISHCFRCGYVASEVLERRSDRYPQAICSAHQLDWSDKAEVIWRRTVPVRDTLAETYLRSRGCAFPPADSDLRYLAGTDKLSPSLCARVSDVRTAKPLSLHFTRLASDGRGKAGSGRDKLLLGGHRKKDGCVRLWPDEAVTYGLAIAEGIETALAAAHISAPVWAAIDAGNLSAFPVFPGVESLTIFADHDDVGLKAAQACGARWQTARRRVLVLRARQVGTDVADLSQRLSEVAA
jgi:putative DNA primase/helicase